MTSRQRKIRPLLIALLLALGLSAVGPAVTASAATVQAAPLAAKACADAPEPNRPTSGLAGKMFQQPSSSTSSDPFTNPGVPISDVYGYSYKWQNYDNGCLPGSGAVAGFNTMVGNLGLGTSGAVHAFTHGLLNLVVVPSWLAPLDSVLTSATNAVKAGFWTPWAGIMMLLVGAGILLAAARANISQAVTSTGWALLALVATTYVMSYPVSSAQAVDGLVQETVTISAEAAGRSAAGTGEVFGPPVPTDGTDTGNPASNALNSMFDRINRETLYTSWLEGTLGSSTSAVARDYGPDLFRASHLTWDEAETLENDPQAGQAIVDAKKELWTTTAAAVERADSAAYQQLTGNNGRWGAAGTVLVSTAFIMPFLAVAAVFLVLAYVATRAFIPLAPAIGVIALLNISQGWVLSVLKNVGRFIILGPLFWVAALVNLAIDSAVLNSGLSWLLKLAICLAIPILLFKLLKPGQSIPGMGGMRRMVHRKLMRRAVRKGASDAKDDDTFGEDRRKPDMANLRDKHYYNTGPVADPTPAQGPPQLTGVVGRRRELVSAPQGNHAQPPAPTSHTRADTPADTRALAQTEKRNQLAPGKARELGAGSVSRSRQRALPPTFAALPRGSNETHPAELEPGQQRASLEGAETHRPVSGDLGERALAGGGRHPAITATPDSEYRPMQRGQRPPLESSQTPEENLAAPASTTAPPPTIMQRSDPLPTGIVEANARTVDGAEVFEIWHPPTAAQTGTDHDEEYR